MKKSKQRLRGIVALMLTVTLVAGVIPFNLLGLIDLSPRLTEAAEYSGGSGTEADPYLISTIEDLETLAAETETVRYNDMDRKSAHDGMYFKMTNDIDLSTKYSATTGQSWTPIGKSYFYQFGGTFDGNGYKVTGLYINNTTGGYLGFIGYPTANAVIENLDVSGIINSESSSSIYCGGILGTLSGTIENCHSDVTINITSNAITSSGSTVYAGGIAGSGGDGTINRCYNTGNISITTLATDYSISVYAGGIRGANQGTISNSYNTGNIDITCNSTNLYVNAGGLSYMNFGKIINCYNTGKITYTGVDGYEPSLAGLVPLNFIGTVDNCFYSTAIGMSGSSDTPIISLPGNEDINDHDLGTAKSPEAFASGEVTYLLNGDQSEINWYQTIGTDDIPLLDGNSGTVKKLGDVYYNNLGNFTALAGVNTNNTKDYNPGDEIEVKINATALAMDYSTMQFTLDYDKDKLEVVENSVATSLPNASIAYYNDTSAIVIQGNNPVALGDTSTEIASLKFKVKTGITEGEATINLKDCELMPTGGEADTVSTTGDTVNLHNQTLTLNKGNGVITIKDNVADSHTLYTNYGESGLYIDEERTTALTAEDIVVAESTGYRLANGTTEPLWANDTTSYVDTAALLAATYTASDTLTLQTVKQWTVTIGEAVNGTYTGATDPIVVDEGTAYTSLTLPTFTANENYTAMGWFIVGETTDTAMEGNITSDVTIYAKAAESQFDFSSSPTYSTVTVTRGVTDNKATYNTDIVFDITGIPTGYALTDVYYTVNDGTPVAPEHVSGTTYKIVGSNITGDIVVYTEATPYYTLTFESGNSAFGAEDSTTAYVISGVGGLYSTYDDTTKKLTGTFTIPTPTAIEGYRLLNREGEYLWTDSQDNDYTNATLAEATFTQATTLTVNTIAIYTVGFEAGANGSLEGATSIVVDNGYQLTGNDIPTPVADKGYVFTDWSGYESLVDTAITGNATYTANFDHGTYSVSNGSTEILNITYTGGVTDNKATHGTDVTFTVDKATEGNYEITGINYSVAGDVQNVSLTPDENGVYTISGDAIVGDITITAVTTDTVTISFVTDDATRGTVGGTTSFTIFTNTALGQESFAQVIVSALKGYVFSNWALNGAQVTEDYITAVPVDVALSGSAIEYRAVFNHGTYSVSATEVAIADTEGNTITQATHGTDLTFVPYASNSIVTNVAVTIDGEAYTGLTSNGDGSYTIAGDAIVGDIAVTASVIPWNNEGTEPTEPAAMVEFISEVDYKALAVGTKIAVLNAELMTDKKPMYTGKEFYYSDKYKAYLMIVEESTTAEAIAYGITLVEGAATIIDYSGDINGSGTHTAADAGIINELIYKLRTNPTDMQRLMADIWESTEGEDMSVRSVTAADVLSALRKAVGLE